MITTPALTVIVPGFDVAPYAVEALDSLRAQTRADWTAILIDDASTDATGTLFREAARADSRFRVVAHAQRRGLGAARNTGLDLVRTPFLGFLDADDVQRPRALEHMLTCLDESGSDFVVGAYVRLSPAAGGGYVAGGIQPWVAASTSPARRAITLDAHPDVTGNIVAWSKLSRADFWQREHLRFPEGRLYEDQLVAQQMYTRARTFDVVSEVVVHWRVRADGSSITQREAQPDVLRDCIDAMTAGVDTLIGAGVVEAARARLAQILRMDLPRLADIARTHPDDTYRHALGGFARGLSERAEATGTHLDPRDARTLREIGIW